MGLSPEMKAKINGRAQSLVDEEAKRIANNKRAETRHEVRKENIRQELADLNSQLAGDPDLRRNLSEVLRAKDGYKTYNEVDQIGLCIGLPVSRASGQIALMTEEGIQVLKRHQRVRYNTGSGHNIVECFAPLAFDKADVDELFPKTKFKVGQLADDIANIVLQSPNKE